MVKAKKGISKKTIAAVGAGIGAAAAAAAAAYWFYGAKNAEAHRKSARSWMLKARAEVLEAVDRTIKKAGELDKEAYMRIVEGVLKRYSKMADVKSSEILQMGRDMKAAWEHMQKSHTKGASKKGKAGSKKKL